LPNRERGPRGIGPLEMENLRKNMIKGGGGVENTKLEEKNKT
jgi:hypothetical protein